MNVISRSCPHVLWSNLLICHKTLASLMNLKTSRRFAGRAIKKSISRGEAVGQNCSTSNRNSNWSFERIDLGKLDLNDYDEQKGERNVIKPREIIDEIEISQRKFLIDKSEYQKYLTDVKTLLNISHLNIYLWFCSESKIKEINKFEMKEKHATDILSICNHSFESPEKFKQRRNPSTDLLLGDIVICPSYVNSIMQKEIQDNNILVSDDSISISDIAIHDIRESNKLKSSKNMMKNEKTFNKDDSGISLCLSFETDLNNRLKLLLVHGLLHLLGHDHNKYRSWKMMTARELDVVESLKKLGYPFKYNKQYIYHAGDDINNSTI